ncbi:hypothetical protein [uncultured Jannaschia sp.]|uniref:hypothetical protein n=1 Tax=uncultured Jannaschia sp. TaxID=293347 RepID=UPI0026297616|nr:hypothetical protein [uncultured Jannaschia sp.]
MPRDAYVTLVTDDAFAVGAVTLLRSLEHAGAARDRVVLLPGGVGREALARLRRTGARGCARTLRRCWRAMQSP